MINKNCKYNIQKNASYNTKNIMMNDEGAALKLL